MKIRITGSKGAAEFTGESAAVDAGEWMEDMQPAFVTIQIGESAIDETDLNAAGCADPEGWDGGRVAACLAIEIERK